MLDKTTMIVAGLMTFAVSALSAPIARADQNGGALYLGGLLGLSFINNDVGTKIPVGIDLGYKLHDFPVSVGPFYVYTSLGTQDLQASRTAPVTKIDRGGISFWGAEVNSFLSGGLEGLHIGGKVGIGRQSTSGTDTKSQFAIGPSIGYDRFVAPAITVGGELGYMLMTSDPALNFLNVLATAKLWL